MKYLFSCILTAIAFLLMTPEAAVAAGLGNAGSLTLEGLLVGLSVLGVIGLAVMGLLILSRVRELQDLLRQKDTKDLPAKPQDVTNMDATEIGLLLLERNKYKQKNNSSACTS